MRILLLSHSFNSLTQRIYVELVEHGHEVTVEFDINDAVTIQATDLYRPDLIIAPFLKRAIPDTVWKKYLCLVVHPGPPGDGGPASLDWAILENASEWGVTVLQATDVLDGGPVWAYRRFPMRRATKSSLYRNEVSEAAVSAMLEAVDHLMRNHIQPPSLLQLGNITPHWRGPVRQTDRAINWNVDDTDTVLRKIAAADGTPGVRDLICGRDVYLHNASRADVETTGFVAGELMAYADHSIVLATLDGAVWIGQLKPAGISGAIKLPATRVLAGRIENAVRLPEPEEITYQEDGLVGYLRFPFLNGAMGTGACRRLLRAFQAATTRPTRVIVLLGGPDFWSNGLDLNEIEAASSAADQSWDNINAIDDLSETIIRTTSHVVVSALCGNAGAGGVFLARAADEVWARRGVILNPHYKDMGNLFGSELWTYLLPKHAGDACAHTITQSRLPMGVDEAKRLALVNSIFDVERAQFEVEVARSANLLAIDPLLDHRLKDKVDQRINDEASKPLKAYREEELSRMRRNFYGFDPSYHIARYNFVHKVPKSRTPLTIAHHRNQKFGNKATIKGAAE